jgi:5-methylcytosine-specific restriction endonuclease McrA
MASDKSVKYCKSCLPFYYKQTANQKPQCQRKNFKTERERNAYFDREWRYKVYERDKFTCQVCGYDKGRTLNAHHLIAWSANENLRFELSNGITLCKKCHMGFHNKYGYGYNTLEQFNGFVNKRRSLNAYTSKTNISN